MVQFAHLLMLLMSSAPAQSPPPAPAQPELWYWHHSTINSPGALTSAKGLIDQAKFWGYTGVALWDVSYTYLNAPWWPDQGGSYIKQAMDYAVSKGMKVVSLGPPFGYSGDVLNWNPNWAEGQRIAGTRLVVNNTATALQVVNSFPGFTNASFEAGAAGWDLNRDVGVSIDNTVGRTGSSSALIRNAPFNGRISQPVTLLPWRQYHFRAWVKTQNYSGAPPVFQLLDANDFSKSVFYTQAKVTATQDWTQVDMAFNSRNITSAMLYFGEWGGSSGSLWIDDLTMEETALINVLRRSGTPLRVYDPSTGTAFIEGVDFSPISDPGYNSAHPGSTYHTPPVVTIPSGSRLTPGRVVAIDYYAVTPIAGHQLGMCLTEQGVHDWARRNAEAVMAITPPGAGIFLQYDEMRHMNSCAACRAKGMTAGQLLAWHVDDAVKMYRSLRPNVPIYVWNDMFDPYMNAIDNYFYVEGDIAGSWLGLAPDTIVMNWDIFNFRSSLAWFSGQSPQQRVPYRQIIAGYYDTGNGGTAATGALQQGFGIPGIQGLMYMTYADDYSQMQAFATAAKQHWPSYIASLGTTGSVAVPVYGTGAGTNALLAEGGMDPHYQLVTSPDATQPGPSTYVVKSGTIATWGGWTKNGPTSLWIAPRADASVSSAAGVYTYRTTFDLTGLNPTGAVLTGAVAADDAVAMKLNGATVTLGARQASGWFPFLITSGFQAGTNTIDFVVTNNGASSTGLRVDINGAAQPLPPAPVQVTAAPAEASLSASQSRAFTATVSGTSNTAVTWSLNPAVGSITPAGVYTAPSSIAASQTVTVTATSVASSAAKGSAVVTLVPPAPAGTLPIRVNAGGPAFTDSQGTVWSADSGFAGGATYGSTGAVSNTTTPVLYQTERWNSGAVQYTFNVPDGSCTVNLKFAEIYFAQAGQRVFHIVINGQTVQSSFDIVAAAGGGNRAVDKAWTVNVTNGQITIQLTPVVSNPKISAIEITAGAAQTGTFTPIRVNAGGGGLTDSQGRVWSADTAYTGGSAYQTGSTIANTVTPVLYQTERWNSATLEYRFAAPNGSYTVNLKFAEIFFSQAGQRVFNVVINGQTVQSNFDVFAAAGGANRAVDKAWTAEVTNGQIAIQLVPVVSYPKIGAIEITAGAQPPAFASIRVNAGGAAFTDSQSRVWSADSGYTGGTAYSTSSPVSNTVAAALYQSERWNSGTVEYRFAVPSGTYTVNLKFAEIYFSQAGQRVFNVVINGQTVQSSLDVFAAAGGRNIAVDRSWTVNVTNGQVVIQLVPVVSNPKISAIEITAP